VNTVNVMLLSETCFAATAAATVLIIPLCLPYLLLCCVLQFGTIDFAAVTAELLVNRSEDGTFLSIQGL